MDHSYKIRLTKVSRPNTHGRPKIDSISSTLSISNTKELARAIKSKDSDPTLVTIAKGVFEQFRMVALNIPEPQEIREVVDLIKIHQPDLRKLVIEGLLKAYRDAITNRADLLESLTEIFNFFQHVYFRRSLIALHENPKVELDSIASKHPLHDLSVDELVTMIDLLIGKLRPLMSTEKRQNPVAPQLSALVSLFGILIIIDVHGIKKEKFQQYYDALKEFSDDEDPKVAYLANFTLQAFLRIGNDESQLHSFARRTWHFLKGLALVADSVDPLEPWHFASIFDAVEEFKTAFDFNQSQKDWFVNLSALRYLMLRVEPRSVVGFAEGLESHLKEMGQKVDLRNPYFVIGLVELMCELLSKPKCSSEVGVASLEILLQIRKDNLSAEKRPLTISDKKYQNSVCVLIDRYIYACFKHSRNEVSLRAREIVREHKIQQPHDNGDFIFRNQPLGTHLFEQAVEQVIPIRKSLRHMKTELEQDDQVVNEEETYRQLFVSESEVSLVSSPLNDELMSFLNSDDKVLLVRGDGGSGKSLSLKLFALEQWRRYRLGNMSLSMFLCPGCEIQLVRGILMKR